MTAPYPALVEGSRVARLIAQAVEQEREACAKVCDNEVYGEEMFGQPEVADALLRAARLIRARGSAA